MKIIYLAEFHHKVHFIIASYSDWVYVAHLMKGARPFTNQCKRPDWFMAPLYQVGPRLDENKKINLLFFNFFTPYDNDAFGLVWIKRFLALMERLVKRLPRKSPRSSQRDLALYYTSVWASSGCPVQGLSMNVPWIQKSLQWLLRISLMNLATALAACRRPSLKILSYTWLGPLSCPWQQETPLDFMRRKMIILKKILISKEISRRCVFRNASWWKICSFQIQRNGSWKHTDVCSVELSA